MRYRFVTCDVFTDRRFGGNQLAVLPEAEGLSLAQMQRIAAEFNYAETTFVLPPADPAHLARVRIFARKAELPFAGHPTVGTALVLAWLGRAPADGLVVLGEGAGPVPVVLRSEGGQAAHAEFSAPVRPKRGASARPELVAAALGLGPDELVAEDGLPADCSTGLPFLVVELASRAALARAGMRGTGEGLSPASEGRVYLFTRDAVGSGADLRARMFAPAHGNGEDAATGSAAAALAGYLGGQPGLADGWHAWRIAQGVEMGRPSLIEARAQRKAAEVAEVRIGGQAVPVAEGTIEVDA
jgi:trans-2,3-dihydro-3-hydroxyanthranilate isomerase